MFNIYLPLVYKFWNKLHCENRRKVANTCSKFVENYAMFSISNVIIDHFQYLHTEQVITGWFFVCSNFRTGPKTNATPPRNTTAKWNAPWTDGPSWKTPNSSACPTNKNPSTSVGRTLRSSLRRTCLRTPLSSSATDTFRLSTEKFTPFRRLLTNAVLTFWPEVGL